ncbi:MAG TPA: VOC family protein [Cyclobacteriaceae bacterium]|nr:VOC family protein [Cyclobacteriaceae bacterium]
MEMLHHAVNWIEIPVANFERAKKFYSHIYDFDMPEMKMGNNRMGFLLFDQEKAGIGAAIVSGEEYTPSKQGAKAYLNAGANLNVVLERVTPAGGKVIQSKTLVAPDMGYYAVIEDSEGNEIRLHSNG